MRPPGRSAAAAARLEQLAGELADLGGATERATLAAVLDDLASPLRVTVAGRVKAGKSTLVNALVGQRVAPTRATECTTVATVFRFGHPARAEVVLRDSRRRELPLVGGRLSEELGADPSEVDRVDVQLPSRALRDIVLVDTPGLATSDDELTRATLRAVLGDPDADPPTPRSDVLVVLLREVEHEDEVALLRSFSGTGRRAPTGPAACIGLLAGADLTPGDDPFATAAARAAQLAERRSQELGAVLPVSGLLAETARTGRLTERHARLLAELSAVDADELSTWPVLGTPEDVDADELDELLDRLGPRALLLARRFADEGARGVLNWLEAVSGIAAFERLVHDVLAGRAAALKAEAAFAALEELVERWPPGPRARGRDVLEDARTDERLHLVREVRALGLLAARGSRDRERRTELECLVDSLAHPWRIGLQPDLPPASLAREARRRAGRATAAAASASTNVDADAARVAARSWHLLARHWS